MDTDGSNRLMTQANETNSRIARLEALMLEIAASNLRHARQSRYRKGRTNDRQDESITQHEREMAEIRAMQRLDQEQLAELTAGLIELRNLVTDYLRGRSNYSGYCLSKPQFDSLSESCKIRK